MALLKTVVFGGVTVTDAYHRIESVSIPKLNGMALIHVWTFKDQASSSGAPLSVGHAIRS